MSALRLVQPQADAPDLDARILGLLDEWDETEAVSVGKALTAQEGYISDLQRRHRDEEKRLAAENAYRLARWTAIVMQRVGTGWHEWMLRSGATTLDKQTLYNLKTTLLAIAPELQGQYNVYPSVYSAAALLGDTTQQANLLGAAEQMDMTARQARTAAQVMRDTGETDVPAFTNVSKDGKMPDEPPAMMELWAAYTEMVSDARERLVRAGVSDDEAMRWALRWNMRGQKIVGTR